MLKLEKLSNDVTGLKFSPESRFLLIWTHDQRVEGLQVWKRTSKTTWEKMTELKGFHYVAPESLWIGFGSIPGWKFFRWDTGKYSAIIASWRAPSAPPSPSGRSHGGDFGRS